MEYTHIHIHPGANSRLTKVNKGNKKLYLPVKNKTNGSINWKTKLRQDVKWGINQ